MQLSAPENDLPDLGETHPALRKLMRLAHLMRALSAGYAAWVLWQILSWWTDTDKVLTQFGKYVNRDLGGASQWQLMVSLALDMAAWLLLLMAVVQCWKFLQGVSRAPALLGLAASHLTLCAWYAIGCQAITSATRPLQSYLLTHHLSADEQVWKWAFGSNDLLATLLCIALLMFAYVFAWTVEVAEENRRFV